MCAADNKYNMDNHILCGSFKKDLISSQGRQSDIKDAWDSSVIANLQEMLLALVKIN